MNLSQPAGVETPTQRISHLDILRGVALLGILLMNIQSYSMPFSAYGNPTSWGNFEGINLLAWGFGHLFADAKFMTIFSVLFGAGIVLFAENAEKKHRSATALHYQRNFWLLIFGFAHAYLLWYGDILYSYAICAFLVYWCRNFSVRTLWIVAIVLLSFISAYFWLIQFALESGELPPEVMEQMGGLWKPSEAKLAEEVNAYTGSYFGQFAHRIQASIMVQTEVFLSYSVWRVSATMMIGMALYKSGILSGLKSQKFYAIMALVGLGCGLTMTANGIAYNFEHNFAVEHSMLGGIQYNYWGSMFTAMGYIGLILLMVNSGVARGLQNRLAAVGQMAFTNYIAQSVICTFVFYGHGLGFFGELERYMLFVFVFAVWALQLWYSPLWLKTHRFGPLEWLWRTLTYRKKQPMKPAQA